MNAAKYHPRPRKTPEERARAARLALIRRAAEQRRKKGTTK